ncbi:hypothetical protein [Oceanicella sp. SM1341]|uniref:AfsR/SARP family transcriptional regulator n=1 Tax=Oceanicella sp. SM1341 TaxID=1548889 RepID=UPI000E48788E|nr:hypothetical protein [Oceanicella sp. SM1341]
MSGLPFGSEALAPPEAGAERPTRLRVELFDGVNLFVDGRRLNISSAKARALITCLVLSRTGEESRAVLSERLWSRSASAEHQRNSLKRDLKVLVDRLTQAGYRGLTGGRLEVRLDLASVDCDVLNALRAAEAGYAHSALLERHHPFQSIAAGCDDVDPEFSHWLAERVQDLEALAMRAIDLALAGPDLEIARRRDLALAAFNLDRTRQPAAITLMRVHEQMGDTAAALRVYGTLYLAHLEEHDDPPDGEILAEVERLKLATSGPGRVRQGAPGPVRGPLTRPSVRIGPPDQLRSHLLRRTALHIIDQLGRRPGQLRLTRSETADHRLEMVEDEGRLWLQLWRIADETLVWTGSAEDDIGAGATATRIAAALSPGNAAPPSAYPQLIPAAPETQALRLLLSVPGSVPSERRQRREPQPLDPLDQAEAGWRDLIAGQRAEAAAALRRAAALDTDRGEALAAAALGLALVAEEDEAVAHAERILIGDHEPGLRALRGTALAICNERRSAVSCLRDLPERWILPRCFGAVSAARIGNAEAVRGFLSPARGWPMPGGAPGLADWATCILPMSENFNGSLFYRTLLDLLQPVEA